MSVIEAIVFVVKLNHKGQKGKESAVADWGTSPLPLGEGYTVHKIRNALESRSKPH